MYMTVLKLNLNFFLLGIPDFFNHNDLKCTFHQKSFPHYMRQKLALKSTFCKLKKSEQKDSEHKFILLEALKLYMMMMEQLALLPVDKLRFNKYLKNIPTA